jgi:hypothetical protein
MTTETSTQSNLIDIVEPVLNDMPASVLQRALLDAFTAEAESLRSIEGAFRMLASASHSKQALRIFFASWSKTNNSAASVSGLANRVTLLARSDACSAASKQLYEVCNRLQRITDEDLGALGGTLHAELFYNMATTICGDDEWLLKSNCLASAQTFKDWTDNQRLRNRDLLQGLLTTLVHEVYTHGEVEFIQPLFREWFEQHMGVPRDRTRFVVAWVTVHVGGTERNHFEHAVEAVETFCEAMEVRVDQACATELFRNYLRRKALVMLECAIALSSPAAYQAG